MNNKQHPSVKHSEDPNNDIAVEDTAATGKRGRPFEPGNTFGQGRPKGSLNKKTLLLQQILLDSGEEILLKLIELARQGDRVARILLVERLIPRLKDVPEMRAEQSDTPENNVRFIFTEKGREGTSDGSQARNGDDAEPAPAEEEPRTAVQAETATPPKPELVELTAPAKPEPINIESARSSLSRMPEAKPMNRSQKLSDQEQRRKFIVPKSPWL